MIMKPSDAYKAENYNITSTLDNDDSTTIYYCNYCNTRLHYESTDEQTSKKIFACLKCGISYIPANQLIRKANKFEVPDGPNKEILTAVPNDGPKASSTQYVARHQNLSPLFRALEQRGFKFTHYEEH